MPRADTDRNFVMGMIHGETCCDACRGLGEVHDKKIALLERDVDELNRLILAEQTYGKDDANNLLRLEGRVGTLENKRAKSEGRDEVRDQVARDHAQSAHNTAVSAKTSVKTVGLAGIALALWQVLEQLPPVKAWLASLGG